MPTPLFAQIRRSVTLTAGVLLSAALLAAAPIKFEIPAQPAPSALMAFSKQAGAEVVFSADALRDTRANEVMGEYESEDALARLLKGTGFTHQRNGGGKFVVKSATVITSGSVRGSLVAAGGGPLADVLVTIRETAQSASTDRRGFYSFPKVAPGTYVLVAAAPGYQPLHITGVTVGPGGDLVLAEEAMRKPLDEETKLEPVVVLADSVMELGRVAVTATKPQSFSMRNVDIERTVNDVQPYYIFDAQDVERSGATSVENFLQQKLTMSTASSTQDQSFAVTGVINQTINLRGLGANQTLVLINGRRISSGNGTNSASSQNINSVPLGAIDHVEVLPSSASAIYGSNAVGGVINIVLKQNYSGGEVRVTYQNTMDTDAPKRTADILYGFSLEGGKTQVMLMASFADQAILRRADRPVLREYGLRQMFNTGLATATIYQAGVPFVRQSSGTANLVLKPAYGGATLSSSYTYVPLGITPTTAPAAVGAALLANAGQYPLAIPASQSRAIFGGELATVGTAPKLESYGVTLRRQMKPWLELYTEFTYSINRSQSNQNVLGTQAVSAASPINPFTTAVTLTLPFNGDWMTQTESKNSRFAGGFLFNLPHGWRAIADYTWNYGTLAYTSHAGVASTDITSFINAGTLNPFVDTTAYPINYQQYQNTGSRDGDGGSGELALRASGPLGTLPGGSPTLSVGLVGRNEGFGNLPLSTKFGNYPGRAQADLLSISVGKRQSTGSGYAEIQAPLVGEGNRFPLVHALTLQAAIRYENYKVHTGTASITVLPAPAVTPVILKNTVRYEATSPTAGFSYRPFKDLMFRVSYGKGFVTPTYAQLMLNETLSTNLTNISDPKRGNATYGVTTFGSGNPDLTPETSKSWNAGVIYEPRAGPLKGLRAGLEYSLIRKSNNIGSLTAQQFVQYEDLYPGRVTRATPIAGDPFGVGQITTVNIAQLNLLKTLNENFDATLAYRVRTERLGSFDLSLRGTFANHFTKKISATTPNVDFAGFTNSGQIKFQGNGYVAWDYRQWTAVWSTRFYSHFRVNGPPITTSTATIIAQGGEFVPSQSYSDVLVTYRFDDRQAGPSVRRLLHGLELQVGVINVFNKTPSFDLSSFVSSYGYSTWGDIRLREYRLSIKKTF